MLLFTMIISMSITIILFGFVFESDVGEIQIILLIILAVGCVVITYNMLSGDFGMRRSARIFSISNVEERAKKLQEMGVEKLLKKSKASILDVSKRGNKLYVIDKMIPNYELKYLVYEDPSSAGKIYGCFVPSDFNTADEAMAWKFFLTEEEYEKDLIFEA